MDYDLIVIGGGPGGYVAAIRAGQLGKKTLLIEKEKLGGMCLNWGCIPSKALLESAKKVLEVKSAQEFGVLGVDSETVRLDFKKAASRAERIVRKLTKGVEFLLKKNSVEIETGEASFEGPHEIAVNNRLVRGEHIILASGSYPGLPDQADISAADLFPFKALLKQEELPKQPLIIGDGPSAVEMVVFFALAGAQPVLLSSEERLVPMADPFVSEVLSGQLKKFNVPVKPLVEVRLDKPAKSVFHGEWSAHYDAIINLGKRLAVLPAMRGAELELHQGFPVINEFLQTSLPHIYAVGDVNGMSVLAHAASAQGLFAVNHICGVKEPFCPKTVPINLYTWPEIAQAGAGEHELQEKNIPYKLAEFSLSANGKAMTEGQSEGVVRILHDPQYGEILGVIIVAPQATDLIAEAVALIEMEATVADAARLVHAHPTISEVMMEAALVAVDAPIHR